VNTVILSFDPNEKQSVICERKQFNNETYGSSRIRCTMLLKISCTRPEKERQKLVSELCMGKTMCMASMRESQDSDQFSIVNTYSSSSI